MGQINFMNRPNWIGAIAGGVLSMGLGALWYSDLMFGRFFSHGSGNPEINQVLINFGTNLVIALTLSCILGKKPSIKIAVSQALFLSIGLIAPGILADGIFGSDSSLVMINAGFRIAQLAFFGLVLSFTGKFTK